ncbi:MAG: glycosyltransferase family 4 protein, partial [Pyrinomonadaceae bacterium]
LWQRLRGERVDIFHLNTAFVPLAIFRDAVYALTARAAGVPVLLQIHGGRFLMNEFDDCLTARAATKMLRSAHTVVVYSEIEETEIEKRWKNLRVRILSNAVPLDEAPMLERSAGGNRLIFFGRFHESKGLHEIIESCRILRDENFDFHFVSYGEGAEKEFFIAEMTELLGDKFRYGGVAAGAEKWKRLMEADVFVLPSRHGEGLPMAMLEAMAAGCVVVVAEIASVGAIVEDGVNGFLVEPYNAPQVAEKLKFLLSNRADWNALRKNARTTIEEKCDLRGQIEKLENFYAEILEK